MLNGKLKTDFYKPKPRSQIENYKKLLLYKSKRMYLNKLDKA